MLKYVCLNGMCLFGPFSRIVFTHSRQFLVSVCSVVLAVFHRNFLAIHRIVFTHSRQMFFVSSTRDDFINTRYALYMAALGTKELLLVFARHFFSQNDSVVPASNNVERGRTSNLFRFVKPFAV